MGSSSSHPAQPPLIALHGGTFGKHNNILVPPEAFAGKWAPRGNGRNGKLKLRHKSKYRPDFGYGYEYGPGPGLGLRRRKGGLVPEGALSDGADARPRRGRAPRVGMPVPVRYHPGVGGGMEVPVVPIYYDPRGVKAMSAPDLQMGYGYGVSAGRGGGGLNTKGRNPVVGVDGGAMPGYGAVPVPGMEYQVPYHTQPQMPPWPQKPKRAPPGLHQVPQGAYMARPQAQSKPSRQRKPEPLVSDRLNRTQTSSKKAGPSGQEWYPGGHPFLDACTCTTNCHCRKGARVLYRAQGEADDEQNTWGEIRYIVKDDLGKDCGNHSKCRAHDDDEDFESDKGRESMKKKGKGKEKREDQEPGIDVKKMREEMAGLRNDLANMRLGGGQMGPNAAMGPGVMDSVDPRAAFDPIVGRVPPHTEFPGVMDAMDPRMAQRLGAGNPFSMGHSPHMQQHMGPTMKRRPYPMPGMGMHRMGDMSLEDEMSFPDVDGETMNPMMEGGMMGIPPHLHKLGGRRPKKRRGLRTKPPRRSLDIDPRLEYGVPPPRFGNLSGPHRSHQKPGLRNRPPHPGYDLDSESGSGFDGRGRPRFGSVDDDEGDWPPMGAHPGMKDDFGIHLPPPPPPLGQSPRGRGRGSGSYDGSPIGGEGRKPNQAHVDDGDDF